MTVTTSPAEIARLVDFFEDVVVDDPLAFKVHGTELRAVCGCSFSALSFDACPPHQSRLVAALIPEGAIR